MLWRGTARHWKPLSCHGRRVSSCHGDVLWPRMNAVAWSIWWENKKKIISALENGGNKKHNVSIDAIFSKDAITFILSANIDVRTIRPRSLVIISSHGHLIPSGGLKTSYVDSRFQRFASEMACKIIMKSLPKHSISKDGRCLVNWVPGDRDIVWFSWDGRYILWRKTGH